MSDQSLRAALEKVLATTDGWAVSSDTLRDLLAAHPAEPAPVVTDELMETAVEAASAAWNDGPRAAIRAAVEAAVPLLGSRPLLDRETVRKAVQYWMPGGRARHIDDLTDAVMVLINGGAK